MNEDDSVDKSFTPRVTVLVPAHNEEKVIYSCLECMDHLDYERGKFEVVIVNDRSTDNTRNIIDDYIDGKSKSNHLRVIHRPSNSSPGKANALKEAIKSLSSEIVVIFDADYTPEPNLIWKLIAPFKDSSVGATMGRVSTYNCNENLLTRLIDLERRAGYGIDQNIRNYFNLLPQFGGTTGAIRLSTLHEIGGWNTETLTEDTDLTYRLYLNGYKIKYLNKAVCFEETPEDWRIRYKQVRRWAYGHNECLLKYLIPTIKRKDDNLWRKIDAIIILFIYVIPVLFILFTAIAFLTGGNFIHLSHAGILFLFFCGIGNFTPFYQIIVAGINDRDPQVIRFLPYMFISSSISLIASSHALILLVLERVNLKKKLKWDKTVRFKRQEV